MFFQDKGIVEYVEQHTIVRDADIAEAHPVLSGTGKSTWLPTHIRIVWQRSRKRGDEWGQWLTTGATVTGPRLKLDNTPRMGAPYVLRYVTEKDETYGAWIRKHRPNPNIP